MRILVFLALCLQLQLKCKLTNSRESPFLPALLTFTNGSFVNSTAQWPARKKEISTLLQQHITGSLPQTRPTLTTVALINSTLSHDRSATSNFYQLTFNTSHGKVHPLTTFAVEILIPTRQNNVGCPLFLTQWNHRSWALVGLSRGYCAIVYPGSDVRDAAPLFQRAYPTATMMLIVARAYVASLILDLFNSTLSMPAALRLPHINHQQICITGHSRNGKQSLLAAAIDARFSAVVGSSPGAPIASPYHLSSHNFYGEGPDAGQGMALFLLLCVWYCGTVVLWYVVCTFVLHFLHCPLFIFFFHFVLKLDIGG